MTDHVAIIFGVKRRLADPDVCLIFEFRACADPVGCVQRLNVFDHDGFVMDRYKGLISVSRPRRWDGSEVDYGSVILSKMVIFLYD